MKRMIAVLLVCVLMMSAAIPLTAFATEDDDFVSSVEQKGDMDKAPPRTGDTIFYVPAALTLAFAVGGVVLYVTSDKKQSI